MLRQLFRTRGACNVVNLPVASTQDDPGPNQGRADYSADWRRQYNPAYAEPEFREDVGLDAWNRPNWYSDRKLSSTAAAKILRKRLETYGPQRERSLQEVIHRIRNSKDAEMALKAAELFRRYRANREQHAPFKCSTSKMIIQRALEVDARDVAVDALTRKDELGFNFISLKAYRLAITHFSVKGDLHNVLRVFELAKKQGMKPNRDIGFCVLRACLDCKRADLAYAYAVEFQSNGLRVSPCQKVLIEGESGKRLPPFPSDDSSETTAENGSSGGDPPPAVVVAVLQEADRIIAAASDAEGATGEGVGAKPLPASVSAEGVAETTVGEGSAVASKAAVTQQSREETSKSQGASRAVVNAVALEHIQKLDCQAVAEAATFLESDPELLRVLAVPGLEDAVRAKCLLLFPKKEKEPVACLQRSNSI